MTSIWDHSEKVRSPERPDDGILWDGAHIIQYSTKPIVSKQGQEGQTRKCWISWNQTLPHPAHRSKFGCPAVELLGRMISTHCKQILYTYLHQRWLSEVYRPTNDQREGGIGDLQTWLSSNHHHSWTASTHTNQHTCTLTSSCARLETVGSSGFEIWCGFWSQPGSRSKLTAEWCMPQSVKEERFLCFFLFLTEACK